MTYREIAIKLCSGYLDMPSGCEGCPLATTNYDADDNMLCELNSKLNNAEIRPAAGVNTVDG